MTDEPPLTDEPPVRDEPSLTDQPPPMGNEPPWWIRHKELFQAIGVLVGIIVLAVTVYQVFVKDTESAPPAGPGAGQVADSPDNVVEEIAQRRIWADPPITYESAEDVFDGSIDRARVDYGDVFAYTPSELADAAEGLEKDRVYVVGRVVARRAFKSEFGLEVEYELAPDDGIVGFVATDGGSGGGEGQRIYALGQVAAVGTVARLDGTNPTGVYFISPFLGDGVHSVEDFGMPGSRNIRDALGRLTDGN